MTRLTFTVRGLPQAQGNAKAFIAGGRAHIATEANRTSSPLGAWRSAIATEARAAMGTEQLQEGPLYVRATFVFHRPKGHYLPANARRPEPVLRLDAPRWHTGKPDGDKLLRALFDALTAVVWRDDAQVAEIRAAKRYEGPGWLPGVVVEVCSLEETA